jgi:alpha-mannosidase
VLDYLEVNPDHKFCLDQVTLLDGFRRLFPNYWDALHQRVLEGRIEIVGGSYVQPDFVLPDGESIVRQFLLGTSFFREELGVEVRTGWAIDSAGHCSQMPQILRQCGIESFFFWRGMPFDSPTEFIWVGPDGSRVTAVWLSSGFSKAAWLSENTREAFTKLLEIVNETGDRASSPNIYLPVGGELVPPLPHLAEIIDRWNETFSDMRAVIVTPHEFIEKLKSVQASLPLISGPLMAGRFSGIRSAGLSSRIRLKSMSRRLESLLFLAEIFLALAKDHSKIAMMDNIWRILLFNQDHNLIRGTCADEPYQLAIRRYNQAIVQAEELLENGISKIASQISSNSADPAFVVFNPLPWTRDDIVKVPLDLSGIQSQFFLIKDDSGKSVPYQILTKEEGVIPMEIALIARGIPSLGHKVFSVVPTEERPDFKSSLRTGNDWVESDEFALEFDHFSGAISRLFDKTAQFEVLTGLGNVITARNDVGDLYRHAESPNTGEFSVRSSTRSSANVEVVESGPVRVVIEVTGEFDKSQRKQRIILYDGLRRCDLETELDFTGQNKWVTLDFPLSIFNDRVAVGAPFAVEYRDTSASEPENWEDPSSETFAALDWIDCSGPEFGVCLSALGLHEMQYDDGNLSVTLLRSVNQLSHGRDDDIIETKTASELGKHSYRLSLIPHSDSFQQAHVWRSSTEHRIPLIAYPLVAGSGGTDANESGFVEISDHTLMLSCLKPTEKQNEYIMRLFEPYGKSGQSTLTFQRTLRSVQLIDLCERDIGDLPSDGNTMRLQIDAHSIITLRLSFTD